MDTKFIDWHTADIIAALRKRGTSLAAESRRHGLSSSTLANALTRPWPKGELIIATALETHPWVIWPSRYHDPIKERTTGITRFLAGTATPRSSLAGGCRNDYSPFTRSILAPSARSLSSIRS